MRIWRYLTPPPVRTALVDLIDFVVAQNARIDKQAKDINDLYQHIGFLKARLDYPDERPADASLVTEEANLGN